MKKIIPLIFLLPLIAFSYMTSITTFASTVVYSTNTGKIFALTEGSTAMGYFGAPVYGLIPVDYFRNRIPGFAFFSTDGNFYVVALKDNQFILQYKKKFLQGIKEIKKSDSPEKCTFYILTISDKIFRIVFHKDIYLYTYDESPILSFDNITEGFIMKDGYFIVYDVAGNIYFYSLSDFDLIKTISVTTDVRKLFLYKNYLLGFTGDGSLFRIDIRNDYKLQFYLNYPKDLVYAFGEDRVYVFFNKDNKTYVEDLDVVHGTYLDYLSPTSSKVIANFKTYCIKTFDSYVVLGGENKFKIVRCEGYDK